MPRIFSLVLLLTLFGGTFSRGELSEQERQKRETFLKAREQMQTLPPDPQPVTPPKPRPTPRATPRVTLIPAPVETPEPTPRETPPPAPPATPQTPRQTPPPKETPPPTSRSTPTPRPTILPRPTPGSTPRPTTPPRTPEPPAAPITIRKSGADQQKLFPPPRNWWGGPTYRYVTGSVRKGIDSAPVKRGRWKFIVVHNSGTRQGNAKIFDFYHRRTRKMPNGMAYHFVIGNGTSTGDGQIELGSRWKKQINGGHVHSDYLNYISLGICLVGDFNRSKPTAKQLEALDELIRYLRTRCGKVEGRYSIVRAHKEINPVPTDCPGDRFPVIWLHRRFD